MSIFYESNGLVTFLGAAIISQCFFSAIYLSTYNWKQNKWLVMAFASILVPISSLLLGESGFRVLDTHLLDNPAFVLLLPPGIYLYTARLVDIPIQRNWRWLLPFAPFLLVYPAIAIVGLEYPAEFFKVKEPIQQVVNASLIVSITITYFYFCWRTLQVIKLNEKKYLNEFADSNTFITLTWLKWMIYTFFVILVVSTTRFCLIPWLDFNILHIELPFTAFLAIIYCLSFFAFRQPTLYTKPSINEVREQNQIPSTTIDKKQDLHKPKKIISNLEREKLALRLETYLLEQKPYLDPQIRMPNLAAALKVSTNVLSYLINEHYQVNFFSFINERRVKHAAQLLADKENLNYTLEAIGKMSGFKSRSTFNSRFKEFHGKTPKAFRDN